MQGLSTWAFTWLTTFCSLQFIGCGITSILSHLLITFICKNLVSCLVTVKQDESWVGHCFGLWAVSQTTLCHSAKKISYLATTDIGRSCVAQRYHGRGDWPNVHSTFAHSSKSYSAHHWWWTLYPSVPLFFYPSQLISIFLSNAMDLM